MDAKQREFILLRADGISYDKIALQLKTSKATLIQWSKLFEDEIKDIQFQSFLQIKEAYSYSQKSKYETLLKQLNKIDDAILEADLTGTQIKDLFTIKNNISSQLEAIEKKISTDAKVTTTNEFGHKEHLRLKLNEVE
jgi:chemotaxis regulatin CheY-phosphate phosphatase CheZ